MGLEKTLDFALCVDPLKKVKIYGLWLEQVTESLVQFFTVYGVALWAPTPSFML